MDRDEREDTTIYKVVINHEEQYSIWPADRENPLGWNDAGKSGLKEECLAYINEVWTDMRPLSLRKKMAEADSNARGDHHRANTKRPPPGEHRACRRAHAAGRTQGSPLRCLSLENIVSPTRWVSYNVGAHIR